MIEPLSLQVARGQRAAADLRDAQNLMSRMAAWDRLTGAEKSHEYDNWASGLGSRFADVPGFEPVACVHCQLDVFADYTADPEGACPFDASHDLWTHSTDRAAA